MPEAMTVILCPLYPPVQPYMPRISLIQVGSFRNFSPMYLARRGSPGNEDALGDLAGGGADVGAHGNPFFVIDL